MSRFAGEWIDINDKIPEVDLNIKFTPCLAVHKDWDTNCRVLLFDRDEKVFTRDGGDTQKVTHWMPLPEPPEK